MQEHIDGLRHETSGLLDFCVHALWGGPNTSPLYDWQTRTVWPKNIKSENTVETKTPTSWMALR